MTAKLSLFLFFCTKSASNSFAGAMEAGTKRRRLPYGRWRQRATSGSYFAAIAAVAGAKRSKADSATAPPGAGPPKSYSQKFQ